MVQPVTERVERVRELREHDGAVAVAACLVEVPFEGLELAVVHLGDPEGVVLHLLQVLRGEGDRVRFLHRRYAVLVVEVVRGVVEQRLVEERLLAGEPLLEGLVDRGPAAGEAPAVHGQDEPCAAPLAVGLQQPVDEPFEVVVELLLIGQEVDHNGKDFAVREVLRDEPPLRVRLEGGAAVPGDVLPDWAQGAQPGPERLPAVLADVLDPLRWVHAVEPEPEDHLGGDRAESSADVGGEAVLRAGPGQGRRPPDLLREPRPSDLARVRLGELCVEADEGTLVCERPGQARLPEQVDELDGVRLEGGRSQQPDRSRRVLFVDAVEQLQQPAGPVPILVRVVPTGVVRLVYYKKVERGRGEDELLLLGAPREMTRREEQRVLGVRVRSGGPHVIGVRAVDLPLVEPRHPQRELLEQLVLPLPADVGRREDERLGDLAVQDQLPQAHAGADRLAEADLVRDEPGARVHPCEPRDVLALVGEQPHAAGRLCEIPRPGQPGRSVEEPADGVRLADWRGLVGVALARHGVRGTRDQRLLDGLGQRVDPEAGYLAGPPLLEFAGPEGEVGRRVTPAAVDAERLEVAGPGGRGLIHRPLEHDGVLRLVPEHPDLLVEVRFGAVPHDRLALLIDRDGDLHDQALLLDEPRQHLDALPVDLIARHQTGCKPISERTGGDHVALEGLDVLVPQLCAAQQSNGAVAVHEAGQALRRDRQ